MGRFGSLEKPSKGYEKIGEEHDEGLIDPYRALYDDDDVIVDYDLLHKWAKRDLGEYSIKKLDAEEMQKAEKQDSHMEPVPKEELKGVELSDEDEETQLTLEEAEEEFRKLLEEIQS